MNQKLLNEFKKYDAFNSKGKNSTIKILVNYIRPSFLFKTKILTPIHLGRSIAKEASKDGNISDDDLKWLYENCIADNDFEGNISNTNRRVGFLTGTYWAYKNYEQLGNPDYFGSFGYRRFLNPDFLKNLAYYDVILPKRKNLYVETIKEQFTNYHGSKLYEYAIQIIKNIYPVELTDFETYLNKTSGYFDEIYILKKEIFFNFCNWIFPLLFEALKLPQCEMKNNDTRDIGFIMERISGYYLDQLTKENHKIYESEIIINEKLVANKKLFTPDMLSKLRKTMK